jgi:DNA mismatch endonuclease (patch repair protein)
MPATRRAWWRKKLEGNRKHDEAVLRSLQEQGWRTVVVWECSFKHAGTKREDALDRVARRVAAFMSSTRRRMEIKGRQTERR